MTLRSRLLLTSLLAGAIAGPALAQTAPVGVAVDAADDGGTAVGELIVTARRQSERAQDVPIPLTAISGATLEEKGTYTLEDIQRQAPSFVAFNSNPRNSSVGIRGIGIS